MFEERRRRRRAKNRIEREKWKKKQVRLQRNFTFDCFLSVFFQKRERRKSTRSLSSSTGVLFDRSPLQSRTAFPDRERPVDSVDSERKEKINAFFLRSFFQCLRFFPSAAAVAPPRLGLSSPSCSWLSFLSSRLGELIDE